MKRLMLAAGMAALSTAAAAGPATLSGPWDGFYAGVLGGFATAPFSDNVYNFYGGTARGLLFGADAGYAMRLSNKLVVGVEGDLSWDNVTGPADGWSATYSIRWDGSLRGVLGWDLGKWMPFVTAGLAVANTHGDDGTIYDYVKSGLTFGGGVAYALTNQLTGKVEFRVSDFGTNSYGGYQLHVTDTSLRAGVDMHF